jgi:hypothetical protein
MKQVNLFGDDYEKKTETQYTSKITIPNYEPKLIKPYIGSLYDNSKTKRIINEINQSSATEEEKHFLIQAAQRHTVFNYQNIADYYAHATPEMQNLMERQALVIIDFEKAYQYGYIKLAHEIANQYFENYGE